MEAITIIKKTDQERSSSARFASAKNRPPIQAHLIIFNNIEKGLEYGK